MCAVSDTHATDAHAYFLPMAYAIAKHNALIRVRFPVSDPLYLQIESCFFGAFWDMPLQLLAFLDAAERSCEISGEQHDSFAIKLKEKLASARCTADKPERDRNGMIKWKKSLTFACATLADEIESRARAFFNCVYSLRNIDRRSLGSYERAFWMRCKRLRKCKKRAKRDKEDIYCVLMCLKRRLPDGVSTMVIRMAL